MKQKIVYIALVIGCSLITAPAKAQYRINNTKENVVKVSGTSNVHDWSMKALDPVCEAQFGLLSGENNVPKGVSSLSFSVISRNLKSESGTMDSRTYKLLKADAHPKISFKLSNAVVSPVSKNKFNVKATGALTIAGVTKTVVMKVDGEVNADGSIQCVGKETIRLTDFNIQPPSYMLGAMKVGNEIDISFSLNFKK